MTEKQKDRLTGVVAGTVLGMAIATIFCHIFFNKKIDKLDAKIMKLEGWQ